MHLLKGGIAFFDSGIGGLTVLADCKKRMPRETFYYYGDNGRAPYGNLPPDTIRSLVFAAFEKFVPLDVKAAVVACNTATALCIEELRKHYPFPIVGAEPAVFTASKRGGDVYVLATRATCASARFLSLCKRAEEKYPQAKLFPVACEGLAGAVEKHLFDKDFDFSSYLPKGKPNSVVLGCTHYIYLKEQIGAFYGCETYDGNEGMSRRLQSFLTDQAEEKKYLSESERRWTENAPVFFLGDQKNVNEAIFEQTFGKTRGFSGFLVDKKPKIF